MAVFQLVALLLSSGLHLMVESSSQCPECCTCEYIHQPEDYSNSSLGYYATLCKDNLSLSPYDAQGLSLKILDLTAPNLNVTKPNDAPGNNQEFNWRLSITNSLTFQSEAFVNARVNLYIYNVPKLSFEQNVFVNCRGFVILFDVTEIVVSQKTMENSDVKVVVVGSKTSVNFQGTNKTLSGFKSIIFQSTQDDIELSDSIVVANLAIEVVVLAFCLVVLVLTVVATLSVGNLRRQKFQSIQLKPRVQLNDDETRRPPHGKTTTGPPCLPPRTMRHN